MGGRSYIADGFGFGGSDDGIGDSCWVWVLQGCMIMIVRPTFMHVGRIDFYWAPGKGISVVDGV